MNRRILEAFPGRLSEVRGKRSQSQFAKELGVRQQNVNRYERGEVVPGIDFWIRVNEKEGINLNWLILGEGQMKSRKRSR